MKKSTRYKDEPIHFKVVKDFLPSPEQLVKKIKEVKVTLTVPQSTVDALSGFSNKSHGVEKVMAAVLNEYASKSNK